jgi:hypothetical protein
MIAKWNNKISKTPTFKADSIKHLIHLAASSELLAPNLKTLVNRDKGKSYYHNQAEQYKLSNDGSSTLLLTLS